MPAIPFFILFAAYGFDYFYQIILKSDKKKITIGCLSLVVILWFTKIDNTIVDKYLNGRIGFISYSNWSFAYAQKSEAHFKENGSQHVPSLKKALRLRNQSIELAEGKPKDTLILNRVYLYLAGHRYEDAYKDLKMLIDKYPNSHTIIKTKNDLEQFLQSIPPGQRHKPII